MPLPVGKYPNHDILSPNKRLLTESRHADASHETSAGVGVHEFC